MNKLIGTYKSLFDNFSLKIEVDQNHPELFIFKKIDFNGIEHLIFIKFLSPGIPGSLIFWGDGLRLSHTTDYSQISIINAPEIGFIGNYQRI